MNTFGHRFRFTTFGESHGKALGCIVDGVPAGIKIDEEFIQNEMNRRKPGQNKYATARKEGDVVEEKQSLMVVEAMKMETNIVAMQAGKIEAILVKEQQQVKSGELLIKLEEI